MEWSNNHTWTLEKDLYFGVHNYKYLIGETDSQSTENMKWEGGSNRSIEINSPDAKTQLDTWQDDTPVDYPPTPQVVSPPSIRQEPSIRQNDSVKQGRSVRQEHSIRQEYSVKQEHSIRQERSVRQEQSVRNEPQAYQSNVGNKSNVNQPKELSFTPKQTKEKPVFKPKGRTSVVPTNEPEKKATVQKQEEEQEVSVTGESLETTYGHLVVESSRLHYEMMDVKGGKRRNLLGEGSYGRVFKAELDGTPVAVKEYRNANEESVIKEYKILQSAPHPNILMIMGFTVDPLATITAFMDGGNLFSYLKKNPNLPLGTRLKMAIEAARAINWMHNRNITHRDIKPGNILARFSTSFLTNRSIQQLNRSKWLILEQRDSWKELSQHQLKWERATILLLRLKERIQERLIGEKPMCTVSALQCLRSSLD